MFFKKNLCVLLDYFSPFLNVSKLLFFVVYVGTTNLKKKCDKAMQWIRSGELNDGHLLKYEERSNKKKATFEKTKVISVT